MRFIIALTRREIRSSWRRLLFFFLCIALGVGSVTALRSLIQNLTRVVGTDARAMMTADIEVTSTNDFSPAEIGRIEETIARFPGVEARNETIATSIMVRPADASNQAVEFAEIRGIEKGFPLVGDFLQSNGARFHYALVENNGVLLGRVLTEQLGVKVGDSLRVGDGTFQIRGTFDEEPGVRGGLRIGGLLFVEKKAFDAAGLVQNSRVRRRILYRTADNPTELVAALRDALRGSTIQVNSYREQQEDMNEQFERMENYLSLVGLLILVLGGVGVWNVARAFVEQKRRTVAILKCLGAGGTRVISVYLLQVLTLGTVGSLLGIALAQLGLWLAKLEFGDVLPAEMSYSLNGSTVAQGLALGIIISVLFSALPLMQIRGIRPKLLLRDENNVNVTRLDWPRFVIAALCLSALLGLAVWQAGSLRVGAYFLAGLASAGLVLYTAAGALTLLLRRFKGLGSFAVRQSINSLYRPGNQTRMVLIAVGLGAFVVLTVQIMRVNLVREFDFARNTRLPAMVFADIQKSQIGAVAKIIEERAGEAPEQVPTVRARIAAINGEPIDYQQTEIRQNQGQIGREFAVTYRDRLEDFETITAGSWWPDLANDGTPAVSVAERMAVRLNVSPGDSMTFDISGRKLTARIASIRTIDMRTARTAFIFVFRPGVLEKAPQSYAATLHRHLSTPDRQRLEREVLAGFPNVQIFDVAEVLAVVNRLIGNFVIAVSFVGSFVLLSGILILIGSVALTKSQRIYENAILKTLGARRSTLAAILLLEYGLLGLLAGAIAAGFAVGMSFAVAHYLMNIDWSFEPVVPFVGIVVTTAIVMLVGSAASFDVLFRKPLATLRSQ